MRGIAQFYAYIEAETRTNTHEMRHEAPKPIDALSKSTAVETQLQLQLRAKRKCPDALTSGHFTTA